MKKGILSRLLATTLSAALVVNPAIAAASQTHSSITYSAASPALFQEQAIVADYLFRLRNFFPKFGAQHIHQLVRTFNGGKTQPLTNTNETGIVIDGENVSLKKKNIPGQGVLFKYVEAAIKLLSVEIPEATQAHQSYPLHLVPGNSTAGDVLAYLHPDLENPKIGATNEFLDGLISAAVMHRAEDADITRLVAFVLQHELLHSLQPRKKDGSTHAFDVADEVLRIQADYALIKKGFLNETQRALLNNIEEFSALNDYVTFLEGLSKNAKVRNRAILARAKAIVGASAEQDHRTMPTAVPTPTLEERFKEAYPENSHVILRRFLRIGPEKELNSHVSYSPSAEEEAIVDDVIARFGLGHALAAMEAMRYSAIGHKVGKFGDTVATDALTRWYNVLDEIISTQAAEGARDSADTVQGIYGLRRLFRRSAEATVAYANDPVEVTQRLQQLLYMACYCIASYAPRKVYELHGMELPSLKLPDHVYMLGVTGPIGSGVDVNLPPSEWVTENMRRAAQTREKDIEQVRVTGLLIRERHLQAMNDTFRTLKLKKSDVKEKLLQDLLQESGGYIHLDSIEALGKFKDFVKEKHQGLVVFENGVGGSVKMITDGDLMANMEIVEGKADISFGAGGVAESMIKTRAAYHWIDFSGTLISHIATEDGNPKALQVTDPQARVLINGADVKGESMPEIDSVRDAGLPLDDQHRVPTSFTKESIAGGPYNVSLVTVPLGDPDTHESDYVKGLHEVNILSEGKEIEITLFAVEPSGRRRLIPLVFDTGLGQLLEKLSVERNRTERASLHASIGRLYGDLKMYREAENHFIKAMAADPDKDDHRRIRGLREYYKGMQELLTKLKPNIEQATMHFREAKNLGHPQAQMMLQVVNPKAPKTSHPSRLIADFDQAIKATVETMQRAIENVIDDFLIMGPEHIWTMRLILSMVSRFEPTNELRRAYAQFVSSLISAALDNINLGYQRSLRHPLRDLIEELVKDPRTKYTFSVIAEEELAASLRSHSLISPEKKEVKRQRSEILSSLVRRVKRTWSRILYESGVLWTVVRLRVAVSQFRATSPREHFGEFPTDLLEWIIQNAPVIAGFGGPGAGKGTITKPLMNALNSLLPEAEHYVTVSTGDYFRLVYNSDNNTLSEDAKRMKEALIVRVWRGDLDLFHRDRDDNKSGKLQRDELVIDFVNAILELPHLAGKRIILDGFPRTGQQYDLLQAGQFKRVATFPDGTVRKVPLTIGLSIVLNVPAPILKTRSFFRWLSMKRKNDPDLRADDLPSIFPRRLDAMENLTAPVIRKIQRSDNTITIPGYTWREWLVAYSYKAFLGGLAKLGTDESLILSRVKAKEAELGVGDLKYFSPEQYEQSQAQVRENFIQAFRRLLLQPAGNNKSRRLFVVVLRSGA